MLTCLHMHMQAREHVKAPVPRLRTTKGRQRRLCWCCDRILADPITTRTRLLRSRVCAAFDFFFSWRLIVARSVVPTSAAAAALPETFCMRSKALFPAKIFLSRCPDGLLCTPFIALWISMPGKAENEQGVGQPLSHLKRNPQCTSRSEPHFAKTSKFRRLKTPQHLRWMRNRRLGSPPTSGNPCSATRSSDSWECASIEPELLTSSHIHMRACEQLKDAKPHFM